ncbi:GntR family transcriptional regulator [Azohydromonas sediminis]|uniref:GntR family transcriptional regulator n=1 Tax=Azohydromonas sediminis TaxID=2259674 RepID=UPI0013C31EEC|nr:GntR family transcriptional regulator [Azohydromonas sediminis]
MTTPRDAGAPLYQQIHKLLLGRLEAGRWQVGDKLPAIPELAEEFSASVVTIRQSLALLEVDGIVRRQRGVGTTVVRDLTRLRWVSLPVTLKQLIETLKTVQPRVLNLRRGASLPEVPIGVDERASASYVRMRRLHHVGDSPYCLIDLALDERLYRQAARQYERLPVLSIMSEQGALKGVAARQQLTIRVAEVDEARHLRIEPGAAVAEVRRTIVDRDGVVTYAAVVLYPSRVVRLDMNLLTD